MRNTYRLPFILISLLASSVFAQEQKLSLRDAVSLTQENNLELKTRKLEIDRAAQHVVVSRSLFLPSINVSAWANHYFKRPVFFGFGQNDPEGKISYGRFGGEDQSGAVLSVVQPLFNPQALSSVKRSKLVEQESRISANGKQTDLVAQVKEIYLQLLVLQERIKLQEQSIQRHQQVLKDARSLLFQGKAIRVDTLRAYTAVRNLEPELLKLSYAEETGKLRLKTLIGLDVAQEIVLSDSLIVPEAATLPQETEVYETAQKNNARYQNLALQESIDEYQIRSASGARLPVVSLVGQYQVQSQANRFEYGDASYPSSSFVGLQVSVPVFTGFSNQAKVKQARIHQEQSVLTLRDANEKLKTEVRQVLANCYESIERIHTSKIVNETATLSFDIVQYRYSRGVASRLELTDAEFALTQARSNYLEAVYDYLSARIALFQLMGTIE